MKRVWNTFGKYRRINLGLCCLGLVLGTVIWILAGHRTQSTKIVSQPLQHNGDQFLGWTWNQEHATAIWCAKNVPQDYEITLHHPGIVPNEFSYPIGIEFHVTMNNQQLYTILGHKHTVFLVQNNVLYFAIHNCHTPGAKLYAYDLLLGREVWTQPLSYFNHVDHLSYLNFLNLRISEDRIVVLGKETAGQYIVEIEAATGEITNAQILSLE